LAYPAPPFPFNPLFETWPAGQTIWRCHPLRRGPLDPNPTSSSARFRPVHDRTGAVVQTAYGADAEQSAIAEGPFHKLPVRIGPKPLARALTDRLALSPLEPTRELVLVSLRGHGLRRLGQTQRRLIEPGPRIYPASAAWGQAAYDQPKQPDGICWVSRQFPGGAAMLLFWDRCGDDLDPAGPTLPLALGRGFDLLAAAANAADVVIVA
jgi:hypothetical protein